MNTRRIERIALPAPAPGTERHLSVVHYGVPGARPRAYLQAGLHANELPGMLVLAHLRELLDGADARGELRGEVVLVPVANPIGLAQHSQGHLLGRLEMSSGRNFNRHYPDLCAAALSGVQGRLGSDAADNVAVLRGVLSEAVAALRGDDDADRLRHTLLGLAVSADICLDLHCDGESLLHVFTAPALWPRAAGLAARLGARAVLLAEVSGGNPFDETVGGPWWAVAAAHPTHPLPAACLSATVELRGDRDVDDDLARGDAAALYDFLVEQGVIAGEAPPAPAPRCVATPLESMAYLRAERAGLLLYHVQPGEQVGVGQHVATLLDPMCSGAPARSELRSDTAGLVVARTGQRFARPGAVVMSIAGTAPVTRPSGAGLLSD